MTIPSLSDNLNHFEEHIDIQKIYQLRSFMTEDQLRDIFKQFFVGEKSGKQRLIDAINNKDVPDVQYNAHSIKGAASFLGLSSIRDYCEFLEKTLSDHDLKAPHEITQRLEIIWNHSIYHANSISL